MNTEQSVKLYHGITNIRAELLEEAQTTPVRTKKKHWVRWVAAAACLCLIAGTAAALTATEFGTRLIRSFRQGEDSWESGYELSIGINKISTKDLTGAIQTVPEQIRAQYKEHDVFSSWFPGHWQESFPSSAQAREFIGYAPLHGLGWDLTEANTTLGVLGSKDGKIQSIELETAYQVGAIRMQAFSTMYTEHYIEEVTTGSYTTEYVEFTTAYRTTENGVQYQVISGTPMESGYLCLDGYLVDSNVLYHLHIAYQSQDAEQAEKLLQQWAELF